MPPPVREGGPLTDWPVWWWWQVLKRGYGEVVVEGEAEEGERVADHLVFVVHGIGEKIWSK